MTVHILLLAAGASTRMRGRDKLLERVEGQPLVTRQARMALATGLPVTVTLPADRPLRNRALDGLDLRIITVADAALGLSASLRAGVAAIPPDQSILMLLCDLPDLTTDDLQRMSDAALAHPDIILRAATEAGQPGHPVVFPPWARSDLLDLTGDTGARGLMVQYRNRTRTVPLSGNRALSDLDTPEDWAAWRARG